MVYGIYRGMGGEGAFCAIVVQQSCNSVGSADREEPERDDSLVHRSCEVHEYLVKANT